MVCLEGICWYAIFAAWVFSSYGLADRLLASFNKFDVEQVSVGSTLELACHILYAR